MYNREEFLDPGAKDTLASHRRAQEERKAAMIREQKDRELKQLETQLFYKKQEVARLKSLFDRVRRELVVEQNVVRKEQSDVQTNARQIKETEARIHTLDQEITRVTTEITDKIAKEKAVLLEHQRVLDGLEKNKQETESKTQREKKLFLESMSRLLFFKKREEQEAVVATRKFDSHQTMLRGTEQSLKVFNQETTVLENKIRSLRSPTR
jgi:chromosome segregation ATPase